MKNILVIGAGKFGKIIIDCLLEIDTFNFYILNKNSTKQTVKFLNKKYNCNNFFKFTNISFDYIIIASSNNHHYEILKNVIKYKCPIFVEKPIIWPITQEALDFIKTYSDIIFYDDWPSYIPFEGNSMKYIVKPDNFSNSPIESVLPHTISWMSNYIENIKLKIITNTSKKFECILNDINVNLEIDQSISSSYYEFGHVNKNNINFNPLNVTIGNFLFKKQNTNINKSLKLYRDIINISK